MRPAAGLVAETLAPGAALEIAGQRPYGLAPEGARGFRPALEYLRDAAALRRRLDEGRAELGVSRSDIPATFVAQLHAWALSAPAGGRAARDGARAGPRSRLGGDRARARHPRTGVRAPRHDDRGAAGDAAAGAPGTHTVADRDGLVGVLWAAVEAHLELLVPALSMATGRPERALWRVGHDAVAMAITGLGELWDARPAAWALWGRRAGSRRRGSPAAPGRCSSTSREARRWCSNGRGAAWPTAARPSRSRASAARSPRRPSAPPVSPPHVPSVPPRSASAPGRRPHAPATAGSEGPVSIHARATVFRRAGLLRQALKPSRAGPMMVRAPRPHPNTLGGAPSDPGTPGDRRRAGGCIPRTRSLPLRRLAPRQWGRGAGPRDGTSARRPGIDQGLRGRDRRRPGRS